MGILQGTFCDTGIPCTFYGENICSVKGGFGSPQLRVPTAFRSWGAHHIVSLIPNFEFLNFKNFQIDQGMSCLFLYWFFIEKKNLWNNKKNLGFRIISCKVLNSFEKSSQIIKAHFVYSPLGLTKFSTYTFINDKGRRQKADQLLIY